jgi:hypothetical protein
MYMLIYIHMVKFLTSIALLLLITFSLDAQILLDQGGTLIGSIDQRGMVRDASGRFMGHIDKDGTVRDSSGRLKGQIDARLNEGDAPGRLLVC